jgi:hypothetical protein
VWYAGSAVDQLVHEHGVVFASLRGRGLAGAPDLAYFEWSHDADNPDDVADEVVHDPEVWARANFGMGIRISRAHIAKEQRSLDARTFAVERLGVGDWPRTDGAQAFVIDLDLWESLTDAASEPAEPVCFAFDVRPDRSRAVIAAVGARDDGLLHVEVVDQRQGTGWLVPRLADLEARHSPRGIVCDGVGPAASLIPELRQAGVSVRVFETPEVAEACGMFFDAVQEQRIRHLGSSELVSAIKGARKRPLGDRWAWSRRSSRADISPLVAVTLGLREAVVGRPQKKMPPLPVFT